MRFILLGLLPLYAEAGFQMKGYDSGEPGSGPCESHTLSWADSQWTNLENPVKSAADVACLDFYEFDAPVSMRIDASACGSSPAATITLATYDSHGCGADLDQSFDFIDGQCLTQDTDPWVCIFINSAGGVSGGHCWNIFFVRLECYDPLAVASADDDDSPDSAGGGPITMILVAVAILLVGVAGGIFVSRRNPSPTPWRTPRRRRSRRASSSRARRRCPRRSGPDRFSLPPVSPLVNYRKRT